jgi:hypothetical protein
MLTGFLLLAAVGQSGPALGWLTGTWCTDPGDGEQTCETWSGYDRKQEAHGVSVTHGRRGTTREVMTIMNDAGRLVFHAEPEGQKPADFFSTTRDHAPPALEFVNAAHDYPQRIRYWREGALLIAEISLADGGKPQRWTYHRAARAKPIRPSRRARSGRAR